METVTKNLPVLAMRGITVFPRLVTGFDVERLISARALERAVETGGEIFLVTQREVSVDLPEQHDLYEIGTIARITQAMQSNGSDALHVVVEGQTRARLRRLWQREPFLQGQVEPMAEPPVRAGARAEALLRQCYALFGEYSERLPKLPDSLYAAIMDTHDPGHLADFLAQHLNLRYQDKQIILDELRPLVRLQRLNELLTREIDVVSLEQEIEGKVRERVGHVQRDFVLREQLKVLQNELGEGDGDEELDGYRARITALKLGEETEKKLLRDVDRLSRQPFGSMEASVLHNYLDTVLELPWGVYTHTRNDVEAARRQLERDHFGLEKVKERILEFIAVRSLGAEGTGQILCLVGPPGVGKTSIALSVAKAMHRKCARLSLGGVRDEADIRGHRKTYVGAMPGRIVEAIGRSGAMDPLLVLDEIDKLASDQRGDPASALLEVLDPQQNHAFCDHYLEIPIDLSRVMFLTTANTTDTIPRPLLDRMEIIELGSYTDEEKLQIAQRHLLPRQRKQHNLPANALRVSEGALRRIIADYTRESGVRQLERQLAKLCRKAAMLLVETDGKRMSVTEGSLPGLLGPALHAHEYDLGRDLVGLVNGLAWTQAGGELLRVEANVMDGTGKLTLTGNLGDVMQESCQAALSFLRSRSAALGLESDFYKTKDIHIHFPEGATPKDGPSAGVAVATVLLSALTNTPVRHDVAMTGEITLRGRVLAIGGLREKTMAALRAGMHTVLLPKENERDLAEIDPSVREKLRFVPVESAEEVFAAALLRTESTPACTQALPYVPAASTSPAASLRV